MFSSMSLTKRLNILLLAQSQYDYHLNNTISHTYPWLCHCQYYMAQVYLPEQLQAAEFPRMCAFHFLGLVSSYCKSRCNVMKIYTAFTL